MTLTPRRRFRPRKRWVVAALLLLVAGWLGGSYLLVRGLAARAHPIYPEPVPEARRGLVEALRLHTSDGEQIGAWFLETDPRAPVVVLLQGRGGTRGTSWPDIDLWRELDCAVLALSLRCTGDSSGTCNDMGYSARHDVIAAVAWLRQRFPQRTLMLHGRSMGAAAAVFAAKELGDTVDAYILESLYTDLPTAARNRTRLYVPPVLEWFAYQGMKLTAPLVLAHAGDIAPLSAMDDIPPGVPVLILSGARDRHATVEESRQLFDKVRDQATLEIFDADAHVPLHRTERERYTHLLAAAAERATRRRTPR